MRESPEETSGYNLVWPPSSCTFCGVAIEIQHNLPIISYLWLGGRSACCQEPISRRYIATEISSGLITAGISFWLLNHQFEMYRVSALLLPLAFGLVVSRHLRDALAQQSRYQDALAELA